MLEGIPLIDAISPPFPPRTTYCMTASPHAQAGFAISQPASWNGHFCSAACVYAEATSVATRRPKPPGWMTSTQAANQGRGEPSLDGDITSCLRAEVSHLWGASVTVVSPGTMALCEWMSGSTWCHGTKADEVLSFCRFEIPLLFFNTVCYQSTRRQTHHPGLLDQSQMPLHER